MQTTRNSRVILCGGVLLLLASLTFSYYAKHVDPPPPGKTKDDQQRNAALLGGYDYSKYAQSLTGYTGQDRQRISFVRRQHAVRTRVGPRGNYKAGWAQLPSGTLVVAVCRNNNHSDPKLRQFEIHVYESKNTGLSWQEIGKTPLFGKEPSLTALPDGSLVLTAQGGYFGPGAKRDQQPISRSKDGGRTWETTMVTSTDYPRNLIVENDGTLLMIRALKPDWYLKGGGSPNLQLARSKDGGKTWEYSIGLIDWKYPGFGEVSAIRLKSGKLLAALRRQVPNTLGEGFEDTMISESSDGGKHWSNPAQLLPNAEVHAYLTELADGRILATYSNYHLPWGVYAVVSDDEGKSWDLEHPIQLALSADFYVGWPVTKQLADGSLVTVYAITAYLNQKPETTVCEAVRWQLPDDKRGRVAHRKFDDVRVSKRAVSQDEITALFKAEASMRGKSTDRFTRPGVSAAAYRASGRLLVRVNYSAMRSKLLPRAAFDVEVVRTDSGKRVAKTRLAVPAKVTPLEAFLDLQAEPPGEIEVSVQAREASGRKIGIAAAQKLQWPRRELRFSPAKGVRVLNNFVFELLSVESPGTKEFTIHNPRESWILVTIPAAGIKVATPTILIDSKTFSLRRVGGNFETMRYLAAGPHKIKIAGRVKADQLIARTIPELFYATYGSNPYVPETGDYTWEWLRKHVLDNYNGIIGLQYSENQTKQIKEWTSQGRRWFTMTDRPDGKTVDEAFEYWTTKTGMTHPLMSGIWVNEFSPGQKMLPIWSEALRRIAKNPKFKDRQFYAYMSWTHKPGYHPLIRALVDSGYRLAPEWYVQEVASMESVRGHFGPEWERGNRANYESSAPEAALNRLVTMGLFSQPGESCDIFPHVDYNVYLDLEFHFLANDPAFFGTRGLQGYYSPYVGEEQTRLFAKLLRHYAIEGHTERMLKDPYVLSHLDNPDFTDGLKAWSVQPAGQGTIAPKTVEKFGLLQGRYSAGSVGDNVIWTKRSSKKANVFAQKIKDLEPGRLYSLRFFTGNYQDYLDFKSRPYKHALSVNITNVDLIPDKSFQAEISSNYAHIYKKFNSNNPYRMNYHQHVFRAKSRTSQLTFSDWTSETAPGGPDGEQLIWNFIQIQPYISE